MGKSWRPEAWNNPHTDTIMSGWVHVGLRESTAFEAGADAMLEALKKEGIRLVAGMKIKYSKSIKDKDKPDCFIISIPADDPEQK